MDQNVNLDLRIDFENIYSQCASYWLYRCCVSATCYTEESGHDERHLVDICAACDELLPGGSTRAILTRATEVEPLSHQVDAVNDKLVFFT